MPSRSRCLLCQQHPRAVPGQFLLPPHSLHSFLTLLIGQSRESRVSGPVPGFGGALGTEPSPVPALAPSSCLPYAWGCWALCCTAQGLQILRACPGKGQKRHQMSLRAGVSCSWKASLQHEPGGLRAATPPGSPEEGPHPSPCHAQGACCSLMEEQEMSMANPEQLWIGLPQGLERKARGRVSSRAALAQEMSVDKQQAWQGRAQTWGD